MERTYSTESGSSNSITTTNDDTPPQIKQATNPVSHNSGFFFCGGLLAQPHLLSPQFRQVMQPSIITTAAVLHLGHSCAPSGKWLFENASVSLLRASNSARFSSTSFC